MRPETASGLAWDRTTVSLMTAWWTAVLAYAAAIFTVSSSPQPFGVQAMPPFLDKVIHAAVFGGFSFTVWMAMRRSRPCASTGRLSLLAILVAVTYGLTDEVHQAFVPGRSMDILDLAADAVGASVIQAATLYRGRPGVLS